MTDPHEGPDTLEQLHTLKAFLHARKTASPGNALALERRIAGELGAIIEDLIDLATPADTPEPPESYGVPAKPESDMSAFERAHLDQLVFGTGAILTDHNGLTHYVSPEQLSQAGFSGWPHITLKPE